MESDRKVRDGWIEGRVKAWKRDERMKGGKDKKKRVRSRIKIEEERKETRKNY